MRVLVAARTDVGQVREGNEDSYLVQDPLFVVADGMGGHVAGEIASQTAVETITEQTMDGAPAPDALEALVLDANRAIWQKGQGDPSLHGMGTTCTLLLLEDGRAHLAHVGDSRAYLFRGGELQQITEDHTLVQRMVHEGRLRQEEADRHPQRNIVTRALGGEADVQVDTFSLALEEGDRLLICSDGLNSMLDDTEIGGALRDASRPEDAADRLIELANNAGGEDNITVVVIDIQDPGGSSSERAAPAAEQEPSPVAEPDTAGPALVATPPTKGKLKPRWARVVVALVLVLAILGAGGYIAFRYLVLDRSYFVGINESDAVTIYRGLPGEVAGIALQEEEEVTNLQLADLPEFLQDNVRDGIDASSLEQAEQQVADLQARAQDEEFGSKPRTQQNKDGKKDRNG